MKTERDNEKVFKHGFFVGILCAVIGGIAGTIIAPYAETIMITSGIITDSEYLSSKATVDKLSKLEQAIDVFYWQDVDNAKLQEGAFRGVVDALNDEYSTYYTEEEYNVVRDSISGTFVGVGVILVNDKEEKFVVIDKVMENSPAKESGLTEGDRIYAVDGESMYGKATSEVASKLKGERNTSVVITVARAALKDTVDISVQRREIEDFVVEHKMYDSDIAYIKIKEFETVSVSQFSKALESVKTEGMKGLIIDLRDNPGGNVSAVCAIAELLLPKGIIMYTEDKDGLRVDYKCEGLNEIDVPLVVLVNGRSASASEILAGAIKDYGIGKLVGTNTYGKGVVQSVITLGDGSAVQITTSSYFTPNGNNIHQVGIKPDIEEEFNEEISKSGVDNQLERAKQVLLEMMQ